MTILFRKISFYLALLGIAGMVLLVVKLAAKEPMPVPPVTPPAKPFAKGLGAAGLVEARNENTLVGTPVAGLVAKVLVKVWDEVKIGQPLFELDRTELEARLIGERAQVAVAEATARMAHDQVDRLERLAKVASGALAEEELTTRRSEAAVAAANVALARAALDQTEAMLARLTVRAPLDGTVLQVNIRAGEAITPASAKPPMLVGNIKELQVRADVDEQVAPRVRAGAAATGYVRGDAKRQIPLAFVRIEPFVIPKVSLTGGSSERVDTRVLQVIYRFANPVDHPLYVGQQMDLFIEE